MVKQCSCTVKADLKMLILCGTKKIKNPTTTLVLVFGTVWPSQQRKWETQTERVLVFVNSIVGIQMQAEQHRRRQSTAEQTEMSVNNRTKGQAGKAMICC